ncbi:MAG: hypothetical protein L0215_18005 [Gemmataceae bacterium]|nr:hypothetical protein [Gemmataceae bacterium]
MKLCFTALCTAALFGYIGAGHAGDKKSEANGTLTLGDKTIKLASALAYENKSSNRKETVVILSEKPLDTAKLKQSFKKNGNDDDFNPSETHVKLTFDDRDRGELSQLTISAGGGVFLRSGDRNIKVAATIKDGVAKGKAFMQKADKFREKPITFEVTFDVKLTKP